MLIEKEKEKNFVFFNTNKNCYLILRLKVSGIGLKVGHHTLNKFVSFSGTQNGNFDSMFTVLQIKKKKIRDRSHSRLHQYY